MYSKKKANRLTFTFFIFIKNQDSHEIIPVICWTIHLYFQLLRVIRFYNWKHVNNETNTFSISCRDG